MREPRQSGGSFRRELTFAGVIVDPQGIALVANRGHERFAVRRNGDAFFFRWVEGDLFRLTVRERLTPQMLALVDQRAEVHPSSVRRPGRREAAALRAHGSALGAAVKWHE